MSDLDDAIEAAATTPKRVKADQVEVEARTIDEMIKARNAAGIAAATTGGRSGWRSLRPARVVPPGSIGP